MKNHRPWTIATLLCVVVMIGLSPILFADYANKIILLGGRDGGGGTTIINSSTNGILVDDGTGTNTTIIELLTVNGGLNVTGASTSQTLRVLGTANFDGNILGDGNNLVQQFGLVSSEIIIATDTVALGSDPTNRHSLIGMIVQAPRLVANGGVVRSLEGGYQLMNLSGSTNLTASLTSTNDVIRVDVYGGGGTINFMGDSYVTRSTGVTVFEFSMAAGVTNLSSDLGSNLGVVFTGAGGISGIGAIGVNTVLADTGVFTNDLIVEGNLDVSGSSTSQHFFPDAHLTYDLGFDPNGWMRDVYTQTLLATNIISYSPTITLFGLSSGRAVISTANGWEESSTISTNELWQLDGVTENIAASILNASNRVQVVAGTGGITVSQASDGENQVFTINDDDAGSGSGAPLTFMEADGTPTVNSVTNVTVTNGTLTDDGDGNVTLSITGAGDVTALGTTLTNQVALWAGDKIARGSTNLAFYDGHFPSIPILNVGASGGDAMIFMGAVQTIYLSSRTNLSLLNISDIEMKAHDTSTIDLNGGDIIDVDEATITNLNVTSSMTVSDLTVTGSLNLQNTVSNLSYAASLTLYANSIQTVNMTNEVTGDISILWTNAVPGNSGEMSLQDDGTGWSVDFFSDAQVLTPMTNSLSDQVTNYAMEAGKYHMLFWNVRRTAPDQTNIFYSMVSFP